MTSTIPNHIPRDNAATGQAQNSGGVRVQLPLGASADYPRTEALIMGLLEAGFALIPHGNMIHAKHRAAGGTA